MSTLSVHLCPCPHLPACKSRPPKYRGLREFTPEAPKGDGLCVHVSTQCLQVCVWLDEDAQRSMPEVASGLEG